MRPHGWKQLWLVIIVLWGVVLLVRNSQLVPNASSISYEDVYPELTPASQAKVYGIGYIHGHPIRNFIVGDDLPTLWVEGHKIEFRPGVSDIEKDAVADDYKAGLQKRITREKRLFATRGLAWWAIFAAVVVVFLLLLPRLRIEKWHSDQLLLVWVGAAAVETALFVLVSGDFVGLVRVAPDLKAMAQATLLLVAPVGAFITTSAFVSAERVRHSTFRDKQWFVVWLAATFLLVVWWNGLAHAVSYRALNSPDYLRDSQENSSNYERGEQTDQTLAVFVAKQKIVTAYAFDHAEHQERTKRLAGTVLALATFGVWFLGRRE